MPDILVKWREVVCSNIIYAYCILYEYQNKYHTCIKSVLYAYYTSIKWCIIRVLYENDTCVIQVLYTYHTAYTQKYVKKYVSGTVMQLG